MANVKKPTGELFSHVYLRRGEPSQDSARFRARLGFFLKSVNGLYSAVDLIAVETGVKVPRLGNSYWWERLVETADIRDLLDIITLLYRNVPGQEEREKYRLFVDRAFKEENLGYRIDEKGGVHFFADEDFEASRTAVLAGLQLPRYQGAREAFEAAHASLGGVTPDALTAVRRAFDAVENVFKLMFGVPRIGASEIRSKLKPHLDSCFHGRSADAAKLMAESLAEWVNAAHQFRHAPNVPDPSPPPIGLALVMISAAAGFLRWLVELDSARHH